MSTKIIVDTTVWIDFFRRSDSPHSLHLKLLLREGRVLLLGVVLAEILQGIKTQKESVIVKKGLLKLPYIEMTRKIWEKAGEISASLLRKGITVPLSDLIVASCALSEDLEVFTLDSHFRKVPGLRLHKYTLTSQ
jgi:predicted nucleic acid-binding protein